jgi:hypothetical protein
VPPEQNMDDEPRVAILIVNWNNYQDTKLCLDSLYEVNYPKLRVILIDNGSEDNSGIRLSREFPKLKLIQNKSNLGFAGGNNIGIQYVLEQDIPYILLLNNDTEVIQPDFINFLVRELDQNNDVCAVGPKVLQPNSRIDETILPYPTIGIIIRNTLGLYRNEYHHKKYVDSVSGCCVLVRSDVIKDVGLLDNNFFMYGEETEWFYRMRKAGWNVCYLPIESIIHKGGSSSQHLENKKIYIERRANVIYTLVKHDQINQARLIVLFSLLLLTIRIIAAFFTPNDQGNRLTFSMIPETITAFRDKWELASE